MGLLPARPIGLKNQSIPILQPALSFFMKTGVPAPNKTTNQIQPGKVRGKGESGIYGVDREKPGTGRSPQLPALAG